MVNQINLNHILFSPLKQDYEKEQSPIGEFTSGLDYMEAMVKFLGVLSISVLKDADEVAYQEVFFKNFKLSPSLGDFKSLSTQCYTKDRMKVVFLKNHTFYQALSQIFKKTFSTQLHLTSIDTLLFSTQSKPIILSNLWELLENYVVTFRNKTKGHGASFRADDVGQIQGFNDTLKQINTTLEAKIDEILKLEGLSFSFEPNEENTDDGHAPEKVFALWEGRQISLSPLLIHLTCKSYSCQHKPHRVKLFFYNDGKDAKSYYIDYSYNHFFYFSQNNEVASTLEEMIALQKAIDAHQASDENRYTDLLDHFVGREEELKAAQEHLLSSMQSQRSSAIVIKGKPGIGKSAFLSKLQSELCVDKTSEHLSYIFYARKGNMGVDEIQYAYNKISNYLNENGIKAESPKSEEANKSERNEETHREKFERLFNALDTQNKPFLLMIDGLDEFDKPEDLIKTLPLENHKHLHIVFSTREYKHLLDALETKLFGTDKPLHVMGAQNYKATQCSLSLGALKEHEAKSLIAEVLTKDIKRESSEYQEILEAIYVRSEALPLYIRYICEQFKTLELSDVTNIAQTVLAYAKALPNGLDNFYHQSFKELSTLSSSILYILYFSRTKVSFDELYTLCQTTVDEKEFDQDFFSKVEIFLSKEEKSYGFYHLSVKEAIKNYFMLDNNTKAIVELDLDAFHTQHYLPENFRREYERLKESFYYLKQESDLFEALEKLYNLLIKLENKDAKLQKYYAKNYLHVAFEYINIKLLQETISFEEMENKAYEKLGSYTISSSLKQSIDAFFKAYRTIKPYDEQQQIRYAFELAFLSKRYKELLDCSVDYKKVILKWVLTICTSPYNEKTFKEFKEIKKVWSSFLILRELATSLVVIKNNIEAALEIAEAIKDEIDKLGILTDIVKKTEDSSVLQRALETAETIKDNLHKSSILTDIVEKTEDSSVLQRALETAETIKDYYKSRTFIYMIIAKTNDSIVLQRALEIAERIKDEIDKLGILTYIVKKTEDSSVLQRALEIAEAIKDETHKSEILTDIVKKTEDSSVLQRALEIAEAIENETHKSEILTAIGSKTNDSIMLQRALEIAEAIENETHKSEILTDIVKKTEDSSVLQRALEIAEGIEDEYCKSKALTAIGSKTNDIIMLQRALEIAEMLEYDEKSSILTYIVEKTEDSSVLQRALEIAETLEYDFYKSYNLAIIGAKTNDSITLQRALEIAETIKNKYYISEILTYVFEKTEDSSVLQRALEIAETIEDETHKSKILAAIATTTEDIQRALEIAERIEGDRYKSEILVAIGAKTNDSITLQRALEIAERIKDTIYKLYTIAAIATATEDIQRALEIAERIEDVTHKSKILTDIVEKTEDSSVLQRALEIAETIEYDFDKSEILAAIVAKTEDISELQQALEIAETIKYDFQKLHYLTYIVKKTEDSSVLQRALEIAETIENETHKSKILTDIVEKIGDTHRALELAERIQDEYYKSKALTAIVAKTNDTTFLQHIFEIAQYFTLFNERYRVLFSLPTSLNVHYTNHLIKQKNDSALLGANEALDFVMQVSHKSVLEHYGIFFEEELTPLQKVVKKLKELKQLRDEAEAKGDEAAYEKADENAKSLKQELMADEALCEAFCEAFSLSKMKLKSADILALEYDDAF